MLSILPSYIVLSASLDKIELLDLLTTKCLQFSLRKPDDAFLSAFATMNHVVLLLRSNLLVIASMDGLLTLQPGETYSEMICVVDLASDVVSQLDSKDVFFVENVDQSSLMLSFCPADIAKTSIPRFGSGLHQLQIRTLFANSKDDGNAAGLVQNSVDHEAAWISCSESHCFVIGRRRLEIDMRDDFSTDNPSCSYSDSLTAINLSNYGIVGMAVGCLRPTAQIRSVNAGKAHCVILDEDGNVYSLGLGSRGELGHGESGLGLDPIPRWVEGLGGLKIVQVSVGGWHSVALTDCGDVYGWGWNDVGQAGQDVAEIGIVREPMRVKVVSCNIPHRIMSKKVATDDDICSAKTIPMDELAQINPAPSSFTSDLESVGNVDGNDVVPDFCSISCGSRHSVALTTKGRLYGCGWNKWGQLGCGEPDASVDDPILLGMQELKIGFDDSGLLAQKRSNSLSDVVETERQGDIKLVLAGAWSTLVFR